MGNNTNNRDGVLPDLLCAGLKLVICGMAAGKMSAALGQYYANPHNRFCKMILGVGLVPFLISPKYYKRLLEFDIGLTDICKTTSGSDKDIPKASWDIESFRGKIERYAPSIVAFNGKNPAKIFLRENWVEYGKQDVKIGDTFIYVLPSTSPAANGNWDESYWRELARFAKRT
jgi:TDG/mug DNA glycosylase family protein